MEVLINSSCGHKVVQTGKRRLRVVASPQEYETLEEYWYEYETDIDIDSDNKHQLAAGLLAQYLVSETVLNKTSIKCGMYHHCCVFVRAVSDSKGHFDNAISKAREKDQEAL